MQVDGKDVQLERPAKILFPEDALTKRDLCDYYRRIAPTALPHFRERPLTMERYPDGIEDEGFFQKELPAYFPDWVDRVELAKEGGSTTYVVANHAATLVYLAGQGCITPHLGLARTSRPHHPDRLIFDLDPSVENDFQGVRFAARSLHDLLHELSLTSVLQTTGSRGLHVLVPLDGRADFDTVRTFARRTAEILVLRHPGKLTIEHRKARRGTAVFIDYLRNAYGQTAVAPYAVRALPGAPIATPLEWHELGRADLGPRRYTVTNIFRRLAQMPDPWADLTDRGQPLGEATAALESVDSSGPGRSGGTG